MFGMNPKDAQGALEDVALFRNLSQAAEAEEDTRVFNKMSVALRERAGTINRLTGELANIRQNRNYAATLLFSAAKTIEQMIRDFAKVSGMPEDEVRKRYNIVRTQNFNREVNEGIAKGWFTTDPRLDMSDEQKQWYVSGLDADHGF